MTGKPDPVTLSLDQVMTLIRAKTMELEVLREAAGLPAPYAQAPKRKRHRRRVVDSPDLGMPSAGELACCG